MDEAEGDLCKGIVVCEERLRRRYGEDSIVIVALCAPIDV
jgi:hypothetical protein